MAKLAGYRVTVPPPERFETRLARGRTVASWSRRDLLAVAVPVGLSNRLWMYCAFLGIARPWNFSVPIGDVLGVAAAPFMVAVSAVLIGLRFAARDEPRRDPDWVDSVKARLSDRAPLGGYRQPFQDTLF